MSLLVTLLAAGCVTVGSLEPRPAPTRPWIDLAAPTEPLAEPSATPTSTARRGVSRRPPPRSASSSRAAAPRAAPTSTTASVSWRAVLDLPDRTDNGGLTGGPGYADLTGLRIDDDGSNARLTVRLAGAPPERLAEGEVVGIGIDLYRANATESDFQLFLDGGMHGWRAFLQTPDGFVPFPGTLRIGEAGLISELPWSSLGGRTSAQVAAFADWSDRGTMSASTHDRLPDAGTHRITF